MSKIQEQSWSGVKTRKTDGLQEMSHIFEEANHQILIRHDRKSLWKAPESVGNGEFFSLRCLK